MANPGGGLVPIGPRPPISPIGPRPPITSFGNSSVQSNLLGNLGNRSILQSTQFSPKLSVVSTVQRDRGWQNPSRATAFSNPNVGVNQQAVRINPVTNKPYPVQFQGKLVDPQTGKNATPDDIGSGRGPGSMTRVSDWGEAGNSVGNVVRAVNAFNSIGSGGGNRTAPAVAAKPYVASNFGNTWNGRN